ncbi:hypothetical protein K8R32_02750 [bacterium]|nr:hypothetical protein [bacterium]
MAPKKVNNDLEIDFNKREPLTVGQNQDTKRMLLMVEKRNEHVRNIVRSERCKKGRSYSFVRKA